MPIGDNTKVNDKAFVKQFGKRSIFSYGCEPGQSKMYIYRITSETERESGLLTKSLPGAIGMVLIAFL